MMKSTQPPLRLNELSVSLIGIKPHFQVCESAIHVSPWELAHLPPGDRKKFFLDFSSLDKIPEFAYENTSFDYEFVSQSHDDWPKSFESNEAL